MACEDYPCCGHEAGCCPDRCSRTGRQMNMVCTCGKKLPLSNRSSICDRCLRLANEDSYYDHEGDY